MKKDFRYRFYLCIRVVVISIALLVLTFMLGLITFGNGSTLNDVLFAVIAVVSCLIGLLAWLFPLSSVLNFHRKQISNQNDIANEPENLGSTNQFDPKQTLQIPELPKTPFPEYSGLLSLWSKRYARTNFLEDLKRLIELYELAIEHTLENSPEWHSYIKELCQLRVECCHRTGSLDDLNKAIELYEQLLHKL